MYWLPALLILPYLILLLRLSRNLSGIKPFCFSSAPAAFISVVIACRDEEKHLPVLLQNLAVQNYPESQFEVIIVNDGSTDKSVEIATSFSGIINLLILDNKGKGKKQALRTGIIAAKSSLIITTDADCRMGKNWIRTIASFFELNNPDMIISPVVLESRHSFPGSFQELEFMSLQGITAGSVYSGDPVMCNGANLAFKREIYLRHSGNLHDEITSGDDVFLLHSFKTEKLSKIIWLESNDAIVTTVSSSTLMSFLKQRSRWISKGKAYSDKNTILLGVVTFAAVFLQASYFVAGLISSSFIWIFLLILILKSIPDFIILHNTTGRYGKSKLMWWFLPVELVYPFYVLSVVFYSLITGKK